MSGLWDSVLEEVKEQPTEESNKYSSKVQVPQYVPRGIKPGIEELCSTTKYRQLIANINEAYLKGKITEEEQGFLKLCACRHLVFNYGKIADYYAEATPEMQRLMEESALVIIDLDDAIANGYVKLSQKLESIMTETGAYASDEYTNQKTGKKNER